MTIFTSENLAEKIQEEMGIETDELNRAITELKRKGGYGYDLLSTSWAR